MKFNGVALVGTATAIEIGINDAGDTATVGTATTIKLLTLIILQVQMVLMVVLTQLLDKLQSHLVMLQLVWFP